MLTQLWTGSYQYTDLTYPTAAARARQMPPKKKGRWSFDHRPRSPSASRRKPPASA